MTRPSSPTRPTHPTHPLCATRPARPPGTNREAPRWPRGRPRRPWAGRALRGGLLLATALAVAAGCVENRNSLTIRHITEIDSSCVASASGGDVITMGTLDVALIDQTDVATQYMMYPVLENNLLSTEANSEIELNNIEVIEARLAVDFGALGEALDADTTRFRYPAFVTVAPEEAVAIQVLAIPEPTARVLATLLPNPQDSAFVRVKLKFLYQLGEYEHETHEVEFPILVCRNCLIPPLEAAVLCDSGLVPDTVREGNPCNPVQDRPVDCCVSGGALVCPAVDTSVEEPATTP